MKSRMLFSCATIYGLIFLLAVVMYSCATVPNEQRIDNIPMYGQPDVPRPEYLRKADQKFIEYAVSGFGGDRKQASLSWSEVAREFIEKGNYHYAMRRYNQAWLLDPNNYEVYWGFGRIMVARQEDEEALAHFEKAKELIDDPYQKPALLHDEGAAYHNIANSLNKERKGERARYFDLANKNFEESTKLDPTHKNAWVSWAYSLYFQGDYLAAWSKVKKARALDESIISGDFLKDLSNKLPEPNP